ncbi:unnamed protein product [Effrenium voratum]|nr:unnamed protein product [Effrenium voratum]
MRREPLAHLPVRFEGVSAGGVGGREAQEEPDGEWHEEAQEEEFEEEWRWRKRMWRHRARSGKCPARSPLVYPHCALSDPPPFCKLLGRQPIDVEKELSASLATNILLRFV